MVRIGSVYASESAWKELMMKSDWAINFNVKNLCKFGPGILERVQKNKSKKYVLTLRVLRTPRAGTDFRFVPDLNF